MIFAFDECLVFVARQRPERPRRLARLQGAMAFGISHFGLSAPERLEAFSPITA